MTTMPTLLACPECDCLQHAAPALPVGALAECAQCGSPLYRNKPHSVDHTLAFFIGAAILFSIANLHPLLALDAQGIRTSATLLGASQALFDHGETTLAILVFMTTILFPAVEIAAMLYMLAPLHRGVVPRHLALAFRAVEAVRPWGMIQVFMVGTLVSLVKLAHIATIIPGTALYSLGGVILLFSAAEAAYEPRMLWARAEELRR
jgi:paraquat-inducible protein A